MVSSCERLPLFQAESLTSWVMLSASCWVKLPDNIPEKNGGFQQVFGLYQAQGMQAGCTMPNKCSGAAGRIRARAGFRELKLSQRLPKFAGSSIMSRKRKTVATAQTAGSARCPRELKLSQPATKPARPISTLPPRKRDALRQPDACFHPQTLRLQPGPGSCAAPFQ